MWKHTLSVCQGCSPGEPDLDLNRMWLLNRLRLAEWPGPPRPARQLATFSHYLASINQLIHPAGGLLGGKKEGGVDGTDPSENEFSHQLPLERGGAWPSGSTGREKRSGKGQIFLQNWQKKGQTVTARKVTHLNNKWESKRVLTQWNQPQANPPSSPS